MKEQYATLGANVVVELYSESHARQPTTRAWAINRQADRNHRPLWPWGWSRWCWCCSQTGGPPRRASDRWPGRLWSSVWSDRLCDLGERRTAGDRCEPLGSDGVWPRRGPGAPRSRGVAALRVADLGWQGDPGRLPPTSEPAMAIALLGGALAGSGPGTSPCVDGLSLVSGKVVPQTLSVQTTQRMMAGSGATGPRRPLSPGAKNLVRQGWEVGFEASASALG